MMNEIDDNDDNGDSGDGNCSISTNVTTTTDTTTNGESFAETWANLKPENLIRGGTPDAIEQKCLPLCHQYIGGSWLNATKPSVDITVKRISGGLTNQLYHVRLNTDTVQRVPNPIYSGGGDDDDGEEPVEVAIKLYQEKHIKNYKPNDYERLNDAIILTILSKLNIGPRVYGIFNEGFIQAYHEHEQFRVKHQRDPAMLRQLAQILARIHHLRLPLVKTENFMLQCLTNSIEFGYKQHDVNALTRQLDLPLLQQQCLMNEWIELQHIITTTLNVPIVFCHNDFRGSNLLVTNNNKPGGGGGGGGGEEKKKIFVVDPEYGCYGARAFDFATLFSEWNKEDLFDQTFTGLPSDDDLRKFFHLYIDAYNDDPNHHHHMNDNDNDEIENLLHETKVFLLVVKLFIIAVLLTMTESIIPNVPFDAEKLLKCVEQHYEEYFQIKRLLINDGTIEDGFLPTNFTREKDS